MHTTKQLIGGATEPRVARVWAVVEPIVVDAGLDLLGVEFGQEGHRKILWVFLDAPENVSIDDCARVSPEISAALDVDDPMTDRYELRVSSPGLDRPLMSDADFVRFIGQQAQLQLGTPVGGRRKFSGELIGVVGDAVEIKCADDQHQVPLSAIQRARLKYELPTTPKRPKKGQSGRKA